MLIHYFKQKFVLTALYVHCTGAVFLPQSILCYTCVIPRILQLCSADLNFGVFPSRRRHTGKSQGFPLYIWKREKLSRKKKKTQYKLSFINRDKRDPYDTLKISVFWFIKGASHWCNADFICENLSNESFKLNN